MQPIWRPPVDLDLPLGVSAVWHDMVPSTMNLATQCTVQPGQHHWIMAAHQSTARGRRGRTWLSPEGAFAGTVVLNPKCTPDVAAQRSFVAACALFDALAQFISPDRLAQKWPNDVLLDGGKVAGILLESASAGGLVTQLSIGIGVNLGKAPNGVTDAAFAPKGLGDVLAAPPTARAFLPHLAQALVHWDTVLQSQGFPTIKDAWMKQAARLGQSITAITGQGAETGTFQGIDGEGNLLLLTPHGQRAIPAADVIF